MQFDQVTVIGGGLAGSECAIQLADRGFAVKLCEMRPQVSSRLTIPITWQSSSAPIRLSRPVRIPRLVC